MARGPRTGNQAARRHPGMRLALIREFHLYIGVFIAPSLLFFAVTGGLQLFSLHEAHGDYKPPALIERLAKVHKDQQFALEKPHGPDDGGQPAHRHHPKPEQPDEGPGAATLALKVFFLAVAAGLVISTLLGLWMALVQSRRKAVAWCLLIAGAAIPIALVLV